MARSLARDQSRSRDGALLTGPQSTCWRHPKIPTRGILVRVARNKRGLGWFRLAVVSECSWGSLELELMLESATKEEAGDDGIESGCSGEADLYMPAQLPNQIFPVMEISHCLSVQHGTVRIQNVYRFSP